MIYENLLLEIRDNIAQLTINRPKALNCLNPQTLVELSQMFAELQKNPEVKVIILTGAGEKAFVAGGDVAVMQPLGPLEARQVAQQAQQLFNDIEYGDKVVIAAVNGYALGGGLRTGNGLRYPHRCRQCQAGATEDQKEGMAAFLEKRPAAWKDK
ncbi:MAG: hypothetical protein BA864_00635 [Desulfuromonadales bacterium C00003093]|nr:MAG: hypothetical protein BA864_00635 [Desulfuromonadales bacterium C00003093]